MKTTIHPLIATYWHTKEEAEKVANKLAEKNKTEKVKINKPFPVKVHSCHPDDITKGRYVLAIKRTKDKWHQVSYYND